MIFKLEEVEQCNEFLHFFCFFDLFFNGWYSLTRTSDYLNRLNQYRKRVWTCKVTGKTGLTYEQALVSEKLATEKVQQIPEELMAPALRIIQYSKFYFWSKRKRKSLF